MISKGTKKAPVDDAATHASPSQTLPRYRLIFSYLLFFIISYPAVLSERIKICGLVTHGELIPLLPHESPVHSEIQKPKNIVNDIGSRFKLTSLKYNLNAMTNTFSAFS